jgi:DNA-binding beta-propeller fold protein YncE
MKKIRNIHLFLALVLICSIQAIAQKGAPTRASRPLVLTGSISMDGVNGRFDHFGSFGDRLFLAALGNNIVEVIDASARVVVHTITGIPTPQGVVFSSEANKLFVGSSKGKLYIYDGTSFELIKEIDFHSDVDNLRYDPTKKRVYVGFGEGETGAIGTVDAASTERLDEEYTLGTHPESFQLETSGPNIYANLPDLKQIAVINRSTHAITRWPLALQLNFPMALDEADHRLFVGTRRPARLAVFDTNSGQMVAAFPCVEDTDDLYYDATRKRVYIAGGEGFISVFRQSDADHYQLLSKVPSALGARTAGYFGKGRKGSDRFYLAVPARTRRDAEIWIYTVQD